MIIRYDFKISFDFLPLIPNLLHNFPREMKKQLDDTSGIVRKRRKLPCSAFDNWMFLKNTQKEQMFNGPLLPGNAHFLHHIFL